MGFADCKDCGSSKIKYEIYSRVASIFGGTSVIYGFWCKECFEVIYPVKLLTPRDTVEVSIRFAACNKCLANLSIGNGKYSFYSVEDSRGDREMIYCQQCFEQDIGKNIE